MISLYGFLTHPEEKSLLSKHTTMLIIWILVVLFFTVVLKKQLVNVFELIFNDMDDMISMNDDNSPNASVNSDAASVKPKRRIKLEELPQFIQKFTSTYFKFAKGNPEKKQKIRAKPKRPILIKEDKLSKTMCMDVKEKKKFFTPKQSNSVFYNKRELLVN